MNKTYHKQIKKSEISSCLKTLGFNVITKHKKVKGYKSSKNNIYTNTEEPLSLQHNLTPKVYLKYGFIAPPNVSNIRSFDYNKYYRIGNASGDGYFEGIEEVYRIRHKLKWIETHNLWLGFNYATNRYEVSQYFDETPQEWFPAQEHMINTLKGSEGYDDPPELPPLPPKQDDDDNDDDLTKQLRDSIDTNLNP